MIRRLLIVISALGFAATCTLAVYIVLTQARATNPAAKLHVSMGEASRWTLWNYWRVEIGRPLDVYLTTYSAECTRCGYIVTPDRRHGPSCSSRRVHVRRILSPRENWRIRLPGFELESLTPESAASLHSLRLNLGYPFVIFGLPLFIWSRRARILSKRRRLGLCLYCGYDLRGLPEPRCPECGKACEEGSPLKRAAVEA